MLSKNQSPWLELVEEILRSAVRRRPIADLRLRAKISPPIPGLMYQDWERVLDSLLEEGLIKIEEGILCRGTIQNNPKFMEGLKNGHFDSWKLIEIYDSSGKFARKFDAEHRLEIGRRGEEEVVRKLHQKLPTKFHHGIRHVSLLDDSVGFDIETPSIEDPNKHVFLEVKTTTRLGPKFNFFLSRNEANVAGRNPNWYLVLVAISDNQPIILGRLKFESFKELLPKDVSENAHWESVWVSLNSLTVTKGLP